MEETFHNDNRLTWIGDKTVVAIPEGKIGWTVKYWGGSRKAEIWDGPDVSIDSSWLFWEVCCCCGDERSDCEPGRSFLPWGYQSRINRENGTKIKITDRYWVVIEYRLVGESDRDVESVSLPWYVWYRGLCLFNLCSGDSVTECLEPNSSITQRNEFPKIFVHT